MNSPPSFAPLRTPPLCFAMRGKFLNLLFFTPPLYEVERGPGGEYMLNLCKSRVNDKHQPDQVESKHQRQQQVCTLWCIPEFFPDKDSP